MKLLKLNQEGIAHWLVPALVMAIVGVVGVRVLTATHAAAPSSVTTSNASKPTPLIYTSSTSSGTTYSVYAYDSSAKSNLIEGPSANTAYQYPSYSPNGKQAVWVQTNTSGSNTGYMQFYNANNQTLTGNYVLPGGETISGGGLYEVKPAWFPGSSKIAFALESSSGIYSIQTLTTSGNWHDVANLSSSYGNIDSVAVTNDGNYVVFGTSTGVYAVKVSDPSKITTLWNESDALLKGPVDPSDTNCYATEAQPGTTDGVGWICNYSGSNVNDSGWEVDSGLIKASSYTTIYSDQYSGTGTATFYNIQDLAWSPNGNELALDTIKEHVVGNSESCGKDTVQTSILGLTDSKGASPTKIASGQVNPSPCKGGGNETYDNNDLAWSPDGSSLAYIDNDYIYAIPPSNSSGSSAPVLVSSNSAELDW
ncbi:MAG TPA: hypothetical protein VMR34_01000 [Candidatus Saccharimonadales bacterium]|nr:hypothetical protein [Candidatus Saccharimonadales bacterium]